VSLRLLLSSALAVAVSTASFTAAADCRNALAGDASSYAPWNLSAHTVETLRDVYNRISLVTSTFPALFVCKSDEFDARYYYSARTVVVTTRVLVELSETASALASVVAHEFAHGELAHDLRGSAEIAEVALEENRGIQAQLLAGGDYRAIVARASLEMKAYKAAIKRDLETEADERGLGIAVKAGFDAAGARAALTRLAQIEGRVAFDPFSDHPDTQQRIADVEQLARNEGYRAMAQSDVATRRPLEGTLMAWRKEVPGSGALAFYDGVERLQSKRRYAPEAFGDAVANFMGEGGISWAGQIHQEEAQVATLALCTSLYEAGQKVTALHCIKKLSPDDHRKFEEWVHPKSILITDIRGAGRIGGLYSGRNANSGLVKITNCSSEAAREDLRPIQLWRPSHLQQVRGVDSLEVCDASLCNCRPVGANFGAELERVER
jgi:hypothetical protein